jgi:hypothetical protein
MFQGNIGSFCRPAMVPTNSLQCFVVRTCALIFSTADPTTISHTWRLAPMFRGSSGISVLTLAGFGSPQNSGEEACVLIFSVAARTTTSRTSPLALIFRANFGYCLRRTRTEYARDRGVFQRGCTGGRRLWPRARLQGCKLSTRGQELSTAGDRWHTGRDAEEKGRALGREGPLVLRIRYRFGGSIASGVTFDPFTWLGGRFPVWSYAYHPAGRIA